MEKKPISELQPKELTQEEQLKELATKLDAEGKKLIPLPPLSEAIITTLKHDSSLLVQLYEEISEKKHHLEEQNKAIANRVEVLRTAQKIQINEQEFNQSQNSIAKYIELLGVIQNEVGTEVAYFAQFTFQTPPKALAVWKHEPDNAIECLAQKSVWIKKYIKTIKKDLAISYSRYAFGFETQMKRLDYVEGYVRTLS